MKLSKIKFPCRTILSAISKPLYPSQAQKRQVLTVYCKLSNSLSQEKCETTLTVLGHMDRKSPSRTNIFQIKPSSRNTLGLGESRAYKVSSVALSFGGEGGIVFLGISHPFFASAADRRKAKYIHGPQDGSGERRRRLSRLGLVPQSSGEPLQCHPARNQQVTAISQSKEHRGPLLKIDTATHRKGKPW